MASLLSLLSEAWIWATSFEALAAHASRAFASALFASVIFAESLGVMKLTTTRFELATVTAAFSAASSALILSTKACCSGGKAGPNGLLCHRDRRGHQGRPARGELVEPTTKRW